MVAHAPHSGAQREQCEAWWKTIVDQTQPLTKLMPVFVLMDANARTGRADGLHVFSHADAESVHTSLFRSALEDLQLCLPSTAACHEGQHYTWTTPDGVHQQRIDYVAVPCTYLTSCEFSAVLTEFDLMTLHEDHAAVGLQLTWADRIPIFNGQQSPNRKLLIDRTRIRDCPLDDVLGQRPLPEWSNNVETHVDQVNNSFLEGLSKHSRTPSSPKKAWITSADWCLRTQKLQAFRTLRAIRQTRRRQRLASMFLLWRRCRTTIDNWPAIQQYTLLRCSAVKLNGRNKQSTACVACAQLFATARKQHY